MYDEVTLLDVSGPLEVLHQANRGTPRYETILVSPNGGTVTTAAGLTLAGTLTPEQVSQVGHLSTTPTEYKRRFQVTG